MTLYDMKSRDPTWEPVSKQIKYFMNVTYLPKRDMYCGTALENVT